MKYFMMLTLLLSGCASVSLGNSNGSVTTTAGRSVVTKGQRPVIVIDTQVHECTGDAKDPACKIEKQQ